jgi:hypothetical protein
MKREQGMYIAASSNAYACIELCILFITTILETFQVVDCVTEVGHHILCDMGWIMLK